VNFVYGQNLYYKDLLQQSVITMMVQILSSLKLVRNYKLKLLYAPKITGTMDINIPSPLDRCNFVKVKRVNINGPILAKTIWAKQTISYFGALNTITSTLSLKLISAKRFLLLYQPLPKIESTV